MWEDEGREWGRTREDRGGGEANIRTSWNVTDSERQGYVTTCVAILN